MSHSSFLILDEDAWEATVLPNTLGSTVASQHVIIIIIKKDGLSPFSLLTRFPIASSLLPPRVSLSLMFSTLSFSGRTIGEQQKIKQIKIKQNHYNPNKQTQIRYPKLFLLLPSASVSLSLSLNSLSSLTDTRATPPSTT
jgi:hypothetical protein